jgi:hypothetical protein
VGHWCNHFCHGKATIRSLFIVIGVDIAEVLTVVMGMQQWVPFGLLSGNKIFRTAVNNSKYYILRVCACIFALIILQANRVFSASYHIAICGLSGSTIFFHIIS